jgi:hypothetical protein
MNVFKKARSRAALGLFAVGSVLLLSALNGSGKALAQCQCGGWKRRGRSVGVFDITVLFVNLWQRQRLRIATARVDKGTVLGSPFLVSGKWAVWRLRSTFSHVSDSSSPRRMAVSIASLTKGSSQGCGRPC